jgi:hypothetical protein
LDAVIAVAAVSLGAYWISASVEADPPEAAAIADLDVDDNRGHSGSSPGGPISMYRQAQRILDRADRVLEAIEQDGVIVKPADHFGDPDKMVVPQCTGPSCPPPVPTIKKSLIVHPEPTGSCSQGVCGPRRRILPLLRRRR